MFWIPSPDVLNRLYGGWGQGHHRARRSLDAVPTTPRDGTILHEENHAEVRLVEDGDKRHITSPDVLSPYGGWGVVHVVPDDDTADFPAGELVT